MVNDNKSILGIIIVGIVGFCILFYNINEDGENWTTIFTLETLGWLLVGIALSLGILYIVGPIPVKIQKHSFLGGEDIYMDYVGGDINEHIRMEHEAVQGGGNILDNVVPSD